MARPGACGLGPGLGLKYEIVLKAGPGLDIIVAGRAGPGPHNSICGPGPGQVSTTAAGPGRAWASNHVCGPGLGLDFRPVQGPTAFPLFIPLRAVSVSSSLMFRKYNMFSECKMLGPHEFRCCYSDTSVLTSCKEAADEKPSCLTCDANYNVTKDKTCGCKLFLELPNNLQCI